MKKAVVIGSVIAATWAAVFFGQEGHLVPSLICTGYNAFVLWANSRKPRAATQGNLRKDIDIDESNKRPIYTYDTTRGVWSQDEKERCMA